MRDALRNLRNRPARTCLTIAGIAIGILALVVVGSLAERLQTIVSRFSGRRTRCRPFASFGRDMVPSL